MKKKFLFAGNDIVNIENPDYSMEKLLEQFFFLKQKLPRYEIHFF